MTEKKGTTWKKIVLIVVGGFLLLGAVGYGGLYVSGFRRYMIPARNMEPTMPANEQVIARLIPNYAAQLSRNEVVVFEFESKRAIEVGGLTSTYAMRVIGFPGDEIRFSREGLWIDGEEYLTPSGKVVSMATLPSQKFVVQEGEYFMIGDNPRVSLDSRYFGTVRASEIKGKILFVE